MALAGVLVALLAGVRFSVEGRRTDLLLATGFLVSVARPPAPSRSSRARRRSLSRAEGWAALLGGIARHVADRGRAVRARPQQATATGRSRTRRRRRHRARRRVGAPACDRGRRCRRSTRSPPCSKPLYLTGTLALQALLALLAVIGWAERFRAPRRRSRAVARARLHAPALRGAPSRLHAAAREPLRRAGRLPAAARVRARSSSAPGARSAPPSSGARSPKSARASRARSTTGSPSTCSPSRRTRRCSSPARRSRRSCRG